MRYCPVCLEEYTDDAKLCSECDEQALVGEEELASRPEFMRLGGIEDTSSFVVAGTAEDPFEADACTAAVHEASIPVMARVRPSSATDALATGVQRPYWEILVPEEKREAAAKAIAQRQKELALAEPDAEKAAEDEELETESAR